MPLPRLEFRLSTLLWLTLAVACFLGGREYQRRESAVAPIRYVKFSGNTIRRRHLERQTKLKVGDPLNVNQVDVARRRLMNYYQKKGFTHATVDIVEGSKRGDRGVELVINEGRSSKIGTHP